MGGGAPQESLCPSYSLMLPRAHHSCFHPLSISTWWSLLGACLILSASLKTCHQLLLACPMERSKIPLLRYQAPFCLAPTHPSLRLNPWPSLPKLSATFSFALFLTVCLSATPAGSLHMLLFLPGTLPVRLIPPYPLGYTEHPLTCGQSGSGPLAPCWLSPGNFSYTCFVCWGEEGLCLPLRPSCEQLEDRSGVFCTHFWSHLQAEPRAGHR